RAWSRLALTVLRRSFTEPLLPGAALERGQCVGAGVEDVDVVSGEGERDGETAGATAEVEHDERTAQLALACGSERMHGVPDRSGAHVGGRRLTGGAALLRVGHRHGTNSSPQQHDVTGPSCPVRRATSCGTARPE